MALGYVYASKPNRAAKSPLPDIFSPPSPNRHHFHLTLRPPLATSPSKSPSPKFRNPSNYAQKLFSRLEIPFSMAALVIFGPLHLIQIHSQSSQKTSKSVKVTVTRPKNPAPKLKNPDLFSMCGNTTGGRPYREAIWRSLCQLVSATNISVR